MASKIATGKPPIKTMTTDHLRTSETTLLGGISGQLKRAIRESGLSMKQLATKAKVAQPIISRFMSDDPAAHRDIRLEKTADRLAEFLGLELVATKALGSAKRKSTRAKCKW
jgi:transcriptional regulator with XRE-family HTH domain